ncbi:MAG: peptide chain release factor N(5)-glutamine methyltransferase [Anaerolineales bacterium]
MEITIQEVLKQLHQQLQPHSETALLDAQVLVAHQLGKPRTWVLAHPETPLSPAQHEKIIQSAHLLGDGEPLPYVLGHWEFYGLDFLLTPDVLIPRPETELLVERAIHWLQLHPHKRKALDVGTGSGCIGIATAKHVPDLHMLMTDISVQALRVARLNAEKYELLDRVEFQQSNLLDRIPRPYAFDLICANLPYIPTEKLNTLPVAKSEPHLALDGGIDGLKMVKRLLKQAKSQLTPGGLMLVEIDPAQRDPMIQLVQKHFSNDGIHILQDLSGRDRCVEIEHSYRILHLCQRTDWLISKALGEYRPESLAREGFIHCSQPEQIIAVANRYYQGLPDMIVLSVDPEKLTSEIRWEKTGDVYYPHVYGPINLEAVTSIDDLKPESDSKFGISTYD